MKAHRRKPGQRIALVLKSRVQSRTVPTGRVLAILGNGQLEAVDDLGQRLRFRFGRDVVDVMVDELHTAVTRAMATEYDDDYGAPLIRTRVVGAHGRVSDLALDGAKVWGNDRFTVQVGEIEPPDGPMRICVHDHHRNPDIPWRLLQRIKNEVAGPDRWAMEWFPDEAHLVDEANERHLFVYPKGVAPPTWLCYDQGRNVSGPDEAAAVGAVQAPLPDWYPEATR